MADHSLSYKLTFSQEQMRAFVEFKEAGSEFFYKYCHSVTQHERWGKACISIVFILVAARSPFTEHNFGLTEEHANSLHEMLKLADEAQKHYSKQAPNFSDAAVNLLEKMFSALRIFRNAVESMVETQ